MISRLESGATWSQTFNSENRLAAVSDGTSSWSSAYDGDGSRVRQTNPDGTGTLFLFGGSYEVSLAADGSVAGVKRYYAIAGLQIIRDETGVHYGLTGHLGSIAAVANEAGELVSQQRHMPFGGLRQQPGITQTDLSFTGQRALWQTGLIDYNARWYGPSVGAFISPDTIVPDPTNPQSLNRYAYVINNPLNYSDPSGHCYIVNPDKPFCLENEPRSARRPLRELPPLQSTRMVFMGLAARELGPTNWPVVQIGMETESRSLLDDLFNPFSANLRDPVAKDYYDQYLEKVYGGPDGLRTSVENACASNNCNNSVIPRGTPLGTYEVERSAFNMSSNLVANFDSTAITVFLNQVGASTDNNHYYNYEPWWISELMRQNPELLIRAQYIWVTQVFLRDPNSFYLQHYEGFGVFHP